MVSTEAQKRARQKFNNTKVIKRVMIEFYSADADLLEKVQSQENKQGYIKELIKKDLE